MLSSDQVSELTAHPEFSESEPVSQSIKKWGEGGK